ncbi:NADH dehydrogenase subunit J [Acidobacteriota bacterium]|nr:NADH dehydrogenase subunit J [Acidobacteriota bacterium]
MFLAFALLTLGSALAMAFQKNVIVAGLFLVATFIGVSGLFILLSNPVSAALQIIVYAGAILVLLLFVIMMLNAHEEESPQDDLYLQRYLALGVGALLVGGSFWFIKQSELLQSLSERPVDQIAPVSLNQIGAEMLTRHIVSFEMIGLLLLVSMIGAISLVKKHL